jgi:hypothetical protein
MAIRPSARMQAMGWICFAKAEVSELVSVRELRRIRDGIAASGITRECTLASGKRYGGCEGKISKQPLADMIGSPRRHPLDRSMQAAQCTHLACGPGRPTMCAMNSFKRKWEAVMWTDARVFEFIDLLSRKVSTCEMENRRLRDCAIV